MEHLLGEFISSGIEINMPLGMIFDEFASPLFLEDCTFEGAIVFENGQFKITNPKITK